VHVVTYNIVHVSFAVSIIALSAMKIKNQSFGMRTSPFIIHYSFIVVLSVSWYKRSIVFQSLGKS